MKREEIIRMAIELGNVVAQSDEMKRFKERQELVMKDPAAFEIINRYQDARAAVLQSLEEGNELTDAEQEQLDQMESELSKNELVRSLIEGQESVDNLMNAVYFAINQAINGPGSGCSSDGCSGCGGSCC
ncbi:MAG: YlbF family regulator [Solirubrobacterales bacterium]